MPFRWPDIDIAVKYIAGLSSAATFLLVLLSPTTTRAAVTEPASSPGSASTVTTAAVERAAMDSRWAVTDRAAASGKVNRIREAITAYRGRGSPDDPEFLWRLSKAYFHLYDELPRNQEEERTAAAESAVRFGERAHELAPDRIPVQYWYAQALLAAADMKGAFQFLSKIRRIKRLMTEVRKAAPKIDDAGPDRFFAILYDQAPWPFGDASAARRHAARAYDLAPYRCANVYVEARARLDSSQSEAAVPLVERLEEGACSASSALWMEIYAEYGEDLRAQIGAQASDD